MTTRYCPACGRAYDLDEHPAFCAGCGQPLGEAEKRKRMTNPFYLDPAETNPAYWLVDPAAHPEGAGDGAQQAESGKEEETAAAHRPEEGPVHRVSPDRCQLVPWQAGLLSLLIVGAGPIANGQVLKGVLMNLIATLFVYLLPEWQFTGLQELLFRMAVLLCSALDGYLCARKLRQGRPLGLFSMFGGRW